MENKLNNQPIHQSTTQTLTQAPERSKKQTITEPIKQQPIPQSQSTNRTINQNFKQATNQTFNQPTNQTINHTINQPINLCNKYSDCATINQQI